MVATARPPTSAPARSVNRFEPLSGIAFVVFFIASVVASSPPKANASDQKWVASYATHAKQTQHLATGILLILAGLSLLVFMTSLWTRVVAARGAQRTSPLPVIAAAASAALIAAGGVVMGSVSGNALVSSAPVPGADILRLTNGLGFALVGLAGMLAAALSVVSLAAQARSCGMFSSRLFAFSVVVAVLLLAGLAFVPIVGLLIWTLVVAIGPMRTPGPGAA
jgi:hypothetical protein